MNHFNCPYDPFTCDYSVFLEQFDESGKVKRWVECVDSYYAEDPRTGRMGWIEKESFVLIVDGTEIRIKKGDLCVKNPPDWWEKYKESKK
jgi:hypothetical protein